MKRILVSAPVLMAANAASAHAVAVPHVHTDDGSAAMWIGVALICLAVGAALARAGTLGALPFGKDRRK